VNGGVVIDSNIIQAEGYLAEENLLLGEKIQIKTLPMLDVRSNDVKASH
jgi:Fe-S cluster assembly scaffold protein SufB